MPPALPPSGLDAEVLLIDLVGLDGLGVTGVDDLAAAQDVDRRGQLEGSLHVLRISAQQALALGLANRVVGRGEAVGEAYKLAKRLADVPPQALRETRRVLNQPLAARIEEALDDVLAAETASFDEDSFRTNLSSLRERSRA
jgi:enoyl-CoA hydratase/carnithine racemase